jgi:S1-C subfamily serine protease
MSHPVCVGGQMKNYIRGFVKHILFFAVGISLLLFFMVRGPELHKRYIVHKVSKSIVKLLIKPGVYGGGTGFVVESPSGTSLTITNAHVCRAGDGRFLYAAIPGTNRYIGIRVIEISKDSDLCVLEPVPGLSALSLANSTYVGQEVAVVGHPKLQPLTLSRGDITNFETITLMLGAQMPPGVCDEAGGKEQVGYFMGMEFKVCLRDYFAARTTAIAYGGNSGSPTVNFFGSVVGLLFAADSETNWGFLIPLEEVKKFLSIY